MYNSYYSRSKRPQPEPEKPQSQYQWRTRVNTLMNTSDEPRESKITSISRQFGGSSSSEKLRNSSFRRFSASSSSDKPIESSYTRRFSASSSSDKNRDSNVEVNNYSKISASKWLKDDKETDRKYTWRDELRRERFLRTKSDDQLKTREVRFLSEDLPTTSKSLDGGDEDESSSFGRLRSGNKSYCRQHDWSSDDDGDTKSPSRLKDAEADNTDTDDNEYGACSGSFDSGLDLRISCSPDERGDDRYGSRSTRSRSHSYASNESLRSKDREDSPPSQPSGLSSTSSSRPIPCAAGVDATGCGTVPKRPRDRSHDQDFEISATKPRHKDACGEFEKSNSSSAPMDVSDEYHYNQSFPPRNNYSDLRLNGNIRQLKDEPQKTSFRTETRNGEEKETAKADEMPGSSFFSDNVDYIEDIIQKVIDAEERLTKDDVEELERLNDALMFSEENGQASGRENGNADNLNKNNDEFAYKLTKDVQCRDHDSVPRKRASSLPARVGDKVDDITRLLFHTWKLKAKKEREEQLKEEEGEEDEWACVPSVFLEDVFTFLSPKERHQASQVCRHWYDLFYSPRVWETFILLERTLTKKRFNLYKGYQRELCPWKTQICLKRVGSFFKRIVITPITDYFNLCEFLRVLAAFLEYQGDQAMPLLHTFDFTFACATRDSDGLLVHGTGGQILDMIVKLLTQMTNLKHLKVNQLLTDIDEVPTIFKALTHSFCECLSSLEMLNITKVPYTITEFAQFRNLIKLTVSPQHINDEVVVLLAGINLLHLHLLQDVYTCECLPVHYEAWKLAKEMAPWLRVYLEISGNTRASLLIQPRAPVCGVFFRTPYSRLTNDVVSDIVEHYSKTLRYLVQEHLPRVHGPRGFDKRCDSSLLFLIRRCQRLHTLVVSERLSTSTLILLATEGKSLSTLLVRQNALIKRCDWPICGEWSREFYARLRENSLDYDKCKDEICSILKRRWRPLSDKQFMRLKIVPKVEIM